MRNVKVSVIVPMYNSEKYIRKCLESVLEQGCQDIEVIVVDDGSTDRGPGICEEMRLADGRIRLCRQENRGVSAARNTGIESAKGEYVFFLDSDDAIHPCLICEMLQKAEEQQADLVFCGYRKLEAGQLEEELERESNRNRGIRWQTAEGKKAEEWFHITYVNELSGIGGKMMRRMTIGSLRFDENLTNGEDTLFLYNFIRKKIRSAYLQKDWYYYRIHLGSVTQSSATIKGKRYFESSRMIRDEEYQRGQMNFALTWERFAVGQIERNYGMLKNAGDQAGCGSLRQIAAEEKKHPMFRHLVLSEKLLFRLCFLCYPVYVPINQIAHVLLEWMEALMKREKRADIGIITFHCSNNYGAMLQAYGLKTFLCRNGKKVDIVRYEPPYMTGRHWWIPYVPIKGLKGRIWGVFHVWNGFMLHLQTKEAYSRQLANMNYFRYKYLVNKKQKKILFSGGLKGLKYKYYIVGSDQIWNPDITCGLKKAYFGAFPNKSKKRVISYAASFGGSELAHCHDKAFSNLIKHVHAVSVREEAAIPYVEKCCGKKVTAVLDPVFFLNKESWQRVERIPDKVNGKGYIFLYVTEPNQAMSDYTKMLSQKTGLSVIEVRAGHLGINMGFEVDQTTGPSELLGYIHKAEYVVSNSFHAVAFSIIYEKQFLAFVHRSLGERMRNIINIHGLQDRLCEDDEVFDINASIDWEAVRQKTKEHVRSSGEFLLKNI